ncbi:MAG: major facilitator superfamily 1 [Frankiales bacterium]|nr:major facilitator superfamily 1 [Frankiales bacterium]
MIRTRWSVLAAFVLVTSANQMLWLTFAPITTSSAEHYGVSEGAIGALSAVFPLLYVVLAIPAGFALDRWFRGSLVAGACLTAAGGLVRLVGDSYVSLLLGALVVAFAQPLVTNSVAKVATAYARDEDRPLGIAVGSAGLFAGFLLAFGTGIALDHDLRLLLAVQAAYALLGAAALSWSLRYPPRPESEQVASGVAALKAVWGDPVIRATTTLVVVGFGVFVGLTTWLQALLEPGGIDADTTGTLLIVMVVAGVVGSAVLPPLVARRSAQQVVLGASLATTVVGCALLAVVSGAVALGVVLAVLGLALLTTLPVVLELTERRAGAASGTAAALLWMAGNAGGLVVTLVLAPLLDHPGIAFGLLALVALAGLPAVRGVKEPERVLETAA